MKIKYITLMTLISIVSFQIKSQVRVKGLIGFESRYEFEPFGNTNLFSSLPEIGCEINSSLRLSLGYKYSLNVFGSSFYTRKRPNYQFLLLKTSYLFNKSERRFSPILSMDFGTQIFSNYKYGFLDVDRYYPFDALYGTDQYPGTFVKSSNFYCSTPFLGSVNGGISIKLFPDLDLNILAGYSLRVIRFKYLKNLELENYQSRLEKAQDQTHISHMLNIQLGLTYTFAFKKTSNSP